MDTPETQTQNQEAPELGSNMPYWAKHDFHERLKDVPFHQTDADGSTIVNVNHFFYKVIGEDLVCAMVPEDLSIPQDWSVVTDMDSPMTQKALSMLGRPMA